MDKTSLNAIIKFSTRKFWFKLTQILGNKVLIIDSLISFSRLLDLYESWCFDSFSKNFLSFLAKWLPRHKKIIITLTFPEKDFTHVLIFYDTIEVFNKLILFCFA